MQNNWGKITLMSWKQENQWLEAWHVCNSTAVLMPLSVSEQKSW